MVNNNNGNNYPVNNSNYGNYGNNGMNNNGSGKRINIPQNLVGEVDNALELFFTLKEDKLNNLTNKLEEKYPDFVVSVDENMIEGDTIRIVPDEGYPIILEFTTDDDGNHVTIIQEGGIVDKEKLGEIADVVRDALGLQAGGRRRRRGAVSKKAKRRAHSMKRTRRNRRRSHRSRK